jgi:butyrate kinase
LPGCQWLKKLAFHSALYIKKYTEFIAPVHVYPGEDEMWALASNGFMVPNGEIEVKVYGKR